MKNTEKCVASLLSKHRISSPPVKVEDIAEKEGVNVVFVEFGEEASDQMHGFYDHSDKMIFVNSADSAEEKQYTIAHELGHHLMHQEYSASAKYVARMKFEVESEYEKEADDFAVRLLVPAEFAGAYNELFSDDDLTKMFLVTNETLQEAKKYF